MSFLKLKRNQIKMIEARGYDISQEDWILDNKLTEQKFKSKLAKKYENKSYPIRTLMVSEYNKEDCNPLFVCYVGLERGSKQIKTESLNMFINNLTKSTEKKDGLLIINAELSPSASSLLSKITESKFQILQESMLLFNVLSHQHVPQHILLTEEETKLLQKETGVNNKLLPIIPHTDPVALYYNFTPGKIVKIITPIDVDLVSTINITYCVIG